MSKNTNTNNEKRNTILPKIPFDKKVNNAGLIYTINIISNDSITLMLRRVFLFLNISLIEFIYYIVI